MANLAYLIFDGDISPQGDVVFYECGQAFYSDFRAIDAHLGTPISTTLIEDLLDHAPTDPILLLDCMIPFKHPRVHYEYTERLLHSLENGLMTLEDETIVSPLADCLKQDIPHFQSEPFNGYVVGSEHQLARVSTLKKAFYDLMNDVSPKSLPAMCECAWDSDKDRLVSIVNRFFRTDKLVLKPVNGTRSEGVQIIEKSLLPQALNNMNTFEQGDIFIQSYTRYQSEGKFRWVYRVDEHQATCLFSYHVKGLMGTPETVSLFDHAYAALDKAIYKFVSLACASIDKPALALNGFTFSTS